MSEASLVNRADLCHENFSSLKKDDFELHKDKFTADVYWICFSKFILDKF